MRKIGTFIAIAVLVILVIVYISQKKKPLPRSSGDRPPPVAVAPPPPPPPPPPKKVEPPPPPPTQPVAVTPVKPVAKRTVARVTRQPIDEELSAFDKAVEETIRKGVEFLWSQQREDGSWPPYGQPQSVDNKGKAHPNPNYHEVGPSALAAYALLASGESVQDPRMVKALDWLSGKDLSTGQRTTSGGRKCDRTYSLALRCNTWLEANKQSPGAYIARLGADARQLWNSTIEGAYGYEADGRAEKNAHWDNSNSQYGLLGVWAAAEGNIEVPNGFWPLVVKHWERSQNPDGGWGYRSGVQDNNPGHLTSKGTMTVAALASLFVCLDYARNAGDFTVCKEFKYKPIANGLTWLDNNFENSLTQAGGWSMYYMYGVERVGLACGYKYFGQKDWYKVGAERLIRNQAGNWGSVHDTAFAVLFLIRGRQAVLVNRLQYEGDWNNRPRAAAWLTRWLGRTFERPLAWQIIHARVPVEEWHDAPILLITGSKQPTFAPDDVERMRQFIQQGGTVLTVGECQGQPFRKAMRELYQKLFPDFPLEPLPREHVIYSDKVHYELQPKCKFSQVSNGVRPLILHVEDDVSLFWQNRDMAGKWAYEMATNAVKYATGSIAALRSRGISHWPARKDFVPARTLRVYRIAHKGNDNPEPLAWERLSTLMGLETQTKLQVFGPAAICTSDGPAPAPASGPASGPASAPANPAPPAPAGGSAPGPEAPAAPAQPAAGPEATPPSLLQAKATLAVLSGTDSFSLTDAERADLRKYLEGGGTLLIDAVGGARPFADSARKELGLLFPQQRLALRTLPPDSPVYQIENFRIDRFRYRPRTVTRLAQSKQPLVQVLDVEGRPAVYFSGEDLTAGLVGYGAYTIDGYEPKTAYEIVRNILLYTWQQEGQQAP